MPPNQFRRATTASVQPTPAKSSQDQRLQETWGKSLDGRVVQRLVTPIMEDLVQSAIAETIPELLAEARQEVRTELERAGVSEASVIMQEMVQEGQMAPT